MGWLRPSEWAKERGLPTAAVLRLVIDGHVNKSSRDGFVVIDADEAERAWSVHGAEMLAAASIERQKQDARPVGA